MNEHLPQAGDRSARGKAVYAKRGNSHYDVLSTLMAVVVVISGIGAAKGVTIGFVITDAAFFLFLLPISSATSLPSCMDRVQRAAPS